jgi:hypothetical protein
MGDFCMPVIFSSVIFSSHTNSKSSFGFATQVPLISGAWALAARTATANRNAFRMMMTLLCASRRSHERSMFTGSSPQ